MSIPTRGDELWTPSGVRMRASRRNPGRWSWLFIPGGPGIGSESLAELVATADLPGTSWLVDLPGDGSNVAARGAPADPYALWPHVLLEAVDAVPDPIVAGHSTGGAYVLSVTGLEDRIKALVLISSAPNAGWLPAFEAMASAHPLPGHADAAERFERDPSSATLRDLAVTSAPWNFEPATLDVGRALLARMPYNVAAVEWSAAHFDRVYSNAWWPDTVPTLIISGAADRVVDQRSWDDPTYCGPHITRAVIDGAGHWPWIDRPRATKSVLATFCGRL